MLSGLKGAEKHQSCHSECLAGQAGGPCLCDTDRAALLGQAPGPLKGRRASAIASYCSVAQLCPTCCDLMDCSMRAPLSFTVSQSLLKFMSIESVMPSNHLILCHPLLLLPSTFPSIRIFSSGSALHVKWPKYWSFSFSISSSNEYSGLISSRIDWFDLLAVQGTLKSLLQNHSSKASILRRSAFFMAQVSHQYMTTGKNHSFNYPGLCQKVMSLLFNMLSSSVIVFLPRSKCLLISWLQSLSTVILEPEKIKFVFPRILSSPSLESRAHMASGRKPWDRETHPWEQAKHKILSCCDWDNWSILGNAFLTYFLSD